MSELLEKLYTPKLLGNEVLFYQKGQNFALYYKALIVTRSPSAITVAYNPSNIVRPVHENMKPMINTIEEAQGLVKGWIMNGEIECNTYLPLDTKAKKPLFERKQRQYYRVKNYNGNYFDYASYYHKLSYCPEDKLRGGGYILHYTSFDTQLFLSNYGEPEKIRRADYEDVLATARQGALKFALNQLNREL